MTQVDKPYIICHMMTTIDGKIASGIEDVDIFDDYFPIYTKIEKIIQTTAWMCGRVTMEMFSKGKDIVLPKSKIKIDHSDFIAIKKDSLFMIAVDTNGKLRWNTNTIRLTDVSEDVHLIILVTKKTPNDYLAYLQEKNISYIYYGEDAINFEHTFHVLNEKFQIKKILLEGGATLNGFMMNSDYIDEISLLVAPIVLNNSSAPSVFEQKNSNKRSLKKYKLVEARRMEKDSLWLRYKRI